MLIIFLFLRNREQKMCVPEKRWHCQNRLTARKMLAPVRPALWKDRSYFLLLHNDALHRGDCHSIFGQKHGSCTCQTPTFTGLRVFQTISEVKDGARERPFCHRFKDQKRSRNMLLASYGKTGWPCTTQWLLKTCLKRFLNVFVTSGAVVGAGRTAFGTLDH